MSRPTLQVVFQVEHNFGPVINNLSRVSPSSSISLTQNIVVSERTRSPYIYHGELSSGQGSSKKVTLKFGTSSEAMKLLDKEHSLYEGNLNHLQGSIISRCFGLYYGQDSRERVMCLVLERCIPKRIHPDCVREHEVQFYQDLLDGLCHIHASGVMHKALYTGNHIMRHEYGPRIIDFSASEIHDDCKGYPPLESHVGANGPCCGELIAFNQAYLKKTRESFGRVYSADSRVVASLDQAFFGH